MESVFRILVWFLLFAGWSAPVVPVESGTAQQAPLEARLDEPFVLNFGASATPVDGLTITFERIVEDSRCPTDVQCFWSGMAVVALRVDVWEETPQVVELGGFTDYDGVLRPQRPGVETSSSASVGGYVVELLAVTPYPAQAGAPPEQSEYQIQLLVRSSADSD